MPVLLKLVAGFLTQTGWWSSGDSIEKIVREEIYSDLKM